MHIFKWFLNTFYKMLSNMHFEIHLGNGFKTHFLKCILKFILENAFWKCILIAFLKN